jgi:aldehyde dehydrogenase (NAD+)
MLGRSIYSKVSMRAFGTKATATPKATQLFINGKWENSASGDTFETINPVTEQPITSVQRAGKEDVDRAVAAARNAFDNGPWRSFSGQQRADCLFKLSHLIQQNAEELAHLEALDNGKPVEVAKAADLPLTWLCYRYYAGWADKILGDTIPAHGDYFAYTRKEPVGVAAQIIPWNFPLLMQAWKLGPALAAGCTIVMKTAEQTPLSALRVGELIKQAGFPDGVVNILSGFGEDAGAHLSTHPGVDKVAFTGSTEVGLKIMQNSSINRLKRVTLELGGKSPNIICEDADINMAIKQANLGLFFNQGQCCIAGSRVFVHEKIYDEFVEKSVSCASSAVLGDSLDSNTTQGPQVSKEQQLKVLDYISKGKKEGAKCLTGGEAFGNKGFYVKPTIFVDVKDDMTIAREEIFGPVMPIMKFSDYDEVVARANSNEYGLGAGIVTKDINRALTLVNSLRAGTVYVNCYDVFAANLPFGGFKNSGIGRELGPQGLENYLENKTVIMSRPQGSLP